MDEINYKAREHAPASFLLEGVEAPRILKVKARCVSCLLNQKDWEDTVTESIERYKARGNYCADCLARTGHIYVSNKLRQSQIEFLNFKREKNIEKFGDKNPYFEISPQEVRALTIVVK